MRRPIARAGPLMTVLYAVCANETSPGYSFYLDELDDTEKAKMNTLFYRMGEQGRISNEQHFKRIEGTDLFEFKNHQIRMPCYFLPGRLLVITHGFRKKGDRMGPSQIARARRIRQEDYEYFSTHGV
jgi:hypothetical protein